MPYRLLFQIPNAVKLINENKELSTFSFIFSAIITFVAKSYQINVFLVFGLIVLITINTYSGVRLAKRKGAFNWTILKNSVRDKLTGYFVLLSALGIFMIVLFVAGLKEETKLFSDYWLNIPVIATIVFFSALEFKSILQNLESTGIKIPDFLKKIPKKIEDNINQKFEDNEKNS